MATRVDRNASADLFMWGSAGRVSVSRRADPGDRAAELQRRAYFTFTEGMLRLDADAYSMRWYRQIVENEVWTRALVNS